MHHNCFISNFRRSTSLVSPCYVEAVAGKDKKITVNMMWRPDVCYYAVTIVHVHQFIIQIAFLFCSAQILR